MQDKNNQNLSGEGQNEDLERLIYFIQTVSPVSEGGHLF